MEKQVKINIKNKDYYCDSEIFKYIMRLQDKVELLEYNRDKAIEYIEKQKEITETYKFALSHIECDKILSILRGETNE